MSQNDNNDDSSVVFGKLNKIPGQKRMTSDVHAHIINDDYAQVCVSDGYNTAVLYLTALDIEYVLDVLESVQEGLKLYERN